VNVIVVGPLSREVKEHKLTDPQWLKAPAGTQVKVVWVTLDEEVARQRIAARGNPNDAYKLAHWSEYRKRRFEPAAADYPELTLIDNCGPAGQTDEDLLKALLLPDSAVNAAKT
jgi:ribose 1,5-bisphosphokinase PhnN